MTDGWRHAVARHPTAYPATKEIQEVRMKRMHDTTEPAASAEGRSVSMQLNNPRAHRRAAAARDRYQSIDDVLQDASLTRPQKRAILASWASDLWAIESCPWLRDVPGVRTPLRVSDLFAALRALDDDGPSSTGAGVLAFPAPPYARVDPAPQPAELQHAG
jgi:hypothetical protein